VLNSTKQVGASAEAMFAARALSKGLSVFFPWGDYLPQDVIVMNGAGVLFKVQIKSTQERAKEVAGSSGTRYKIQPVSGRDYKHPLDCTKVDVLSCYIQELDLFYMVPCMELMGKKGMWLYGHNDTSKGMYEQYKERWEVFTSAKA
jgi:hypothetical protein